MDGKGRRRQQQTYWVRPHVRINTYLAVSIQSPLLTSSKSQFAFTAPNDQLQPILTLYYQLGMSDMDIATSVIDHFDPARYGIRYGPHHLARTIFK